MHLKIIVSLNALKNKSTSKCPIKMRLHLWYPAEAFWLNTKTELRCLMLAQTPPLKKNEKKVLLLISLGMYIFPEAELLSTSILPRFSRSTTCYAFALEEWGKTYWGQMGPFPCEASCHSTTYDISFFPGLSNWCACPWAQRARG